MHALALTLALMVTQAADSRGEQLITYSRTGGWRGMKQELQVRSLRTVILTEDGVQKLSRPLKPAESQRLRAQLKAARKAPLHDDKVKGQLADGFQVALAFDREDKPTLTRDTLTFPPSGSGPAWDALLKTLDGMLEHELKPPPAKKK